MSDPGETPRLLLIPGLLCDWRVWRDVTPDLEDLCDPLVVEGLSDFATIEEMAAAALDRVEGPFALAGYSFGGRIALEMIRQAPERVTRLALMDTGYGPTRESEHESRLTLVRQAHAEGVDSLNRSWLPPMLHEPFRTVPEVAGELEEMVRRQSPESFERQQRAALTRPDATPVLPTIAVPTLVLVGRHDLWSPVAQHEALAGMIPGARLSVIEDAGHFALVEQPQAVSAAMRDWLGW